MAIFDVSTYNFIDSKVVSKSTGGKRTVVITTPQNKVVDFRIADTQYQRFVMLLAKDAGLSINPADVKPPMGGDPPTPPPR